MELVAVVAMTKDRIIATETGVPWDHPDDVSQYKNRVANNPVIVGRTTYESMLPDPPGSQHLVLSQSLEETNSKTVTIVNTVREALSVAADMDAHTIYVVGGGQTYKSLLKEYNRIVVTIVDDVINPDEYDRIVRFPEWRGDNWIRANIDDSYKDFRIEFWKSTN